MCRLVSQFDKRRGKPQVNGALEHSFSLAVQFGVDEESHKSDTISICDKDGTKGMEAK